MKQIMIVFAFIVFIICARYLYSIQLGAIPFFLLSGFFALLAIRLYQKERQLEDRCKK